MKILNGCSYLATWHDFSGINLSQPGSSFSRVCRTTMEYCATHAVEQVLIGIPEITRFEIPHTDFDDKPIEGPYSSTRRTDGWHKIPLEVEAKFYLSLGQYQQYYTFDKFLVDLIGLAGWLDQQNIDYRIWDQCNQFRRANYEYKSIEKLKFVEQNSKIIDVFSFCANSFLGEHDVSYFDTDAIHPINNRHYTDFFLLENKIKEWTLL